MTVTYTMPQLTLIGAAECIVAERGIGALTINNVQVEAKQANKSAVKYHFGSLDALLEALVAVRMRPVAARREAMLDGIEHAGGRLGIRHAVEALIRPLADETLCRPPSHYARFLIQTLFDPRLAELVHRHLEARSFRTVYAHLVELCPAPEPVATWRVTNVTQLSMTALAAHEARERSPDETAAIIDDLITGCTALLDAPSPGPVHKGETP